MMSRAYSKMSLLVVLVIGGSLLSIAASPNWFPVEREQERELAKKEFQEGNFRDALAIYRQLIEERSNSGEKLAEDLEGALRCLQRLQQDAQIDSLFEDAIETHPDDWRLYWKAADLLQRVQHTGQMVAGEFQRGGRRGGGRRVGAFERDHFQRLAWMEKARQKMAKETPAIEQAQFLIRYSQALIEQREGDRAWLLQALTDFDTLPDYEEGYRWGWGTGNQGAPVNDKGEPVLYSEPESFEVASSDGERWRWALEEAKRLSPSVAAQADNNFANFLMGQFSVQTIRNMGIQLPAMEDKEGEEAEPGPWALFGLSDDETIARLATGPKRFSLPDDFNFIKIFRRLADTEQKGYRVSSLEQLASIYKNRQQYEKAAGIYRELQRLYPSQTGYRDAEKQIVDPWGRFEPLSKQSIGEAASIDYVFRNGESVEFTAYAVKVDLLLKDVQDYLRSSPNQIDWQQVQIGNIGYRLVTQEESKYQGAQVAKWTLGLSPRPHHFDRRVTINTPLQQAGAYLVVAKMKDGNTSRIVVWLDDTAIVKKSINNQQLYYVCDAKSGEPIPGAQVDFFGWRQEQVPGQKRTYRVLTSRFAEKADDQGFVTTSNQLQQREYQWLTIARTPGGRLAFMGFEGVWFRNFTKSTTPRQSKAYWVTDRPVYRPDQTVEFKCWIRETKYDDQDKVLARYAGQKVFVKINDPQGTEILKQEMVADEFGGVAGELELPEDAKLGAYYIYLDGSPVAGGIQFRVEEYKKPEFEVTVQAPQKPVQLGDAVKAKVTAKYYYGSPVSEGTLKLKVERSERETRWYPPTPWDWLYGEGYWWFGQTYDWYPGFYRWGCLAPRPYWISWNRNPPELVLQQEVALRADGTYEVEIDTALAKELHGDKDHEYSITAEVVDASRRTIVGQGTVTVAREPFKVFLWTERGHFRVGEKIRIQAQARTPSGDGVAGSGKLQLLQVVYDQEGVPEEQVVQEWELDTDEDGSAQIDIKGSDAGQYRLSYQLTAEVEVAGEQGEEAKKETTIEGGHVFVVRGDGFDGSEFRFNDLELVVDQSTYKVGDKVELMINTNRTGSTILLFLRPANGVYAAKPQMISLKGKSTVVQIPVTQADMPNFFIEAVTVHGGKLHNKVQQIVVPPEKRVVDVAVLPNQQEYLPGEKASVQVKLTDGDGNPVAGSVVLTAYDRAVEYISGGSNIPEIRSFFWNWKRSHNPDTRHSLQGWSSELFAKQQKRMENLGIFGDVVADMDDEIAEDKSITRMSKSSRLAPAAAMAMDGAMGGGGYGGMAMAVEEGMAVEGESAPGGGGLQEATVRSEFADTAFWKADITTDESGVALVEFDMPENLSDWKMRAWGMAGGTRVGEGTVSVVTTKNLVLRLQAPRFFVEKDEVVLSAVVHNYLATAKQAEVRMELGNKTLEVLECVSHSQDDAGKVLVNIPADGQVRVDWRCKAVNQGEADITMFALTDEESDAMKQSFPVFVHGFLKTESFSGVVRANEQGQVLEFSVPRDRRPEQSRLEIRYSPSLAGAMVDALPYLVEYPYGCTEQTLNRFVPTVITQRILQRMDLDLEDIRDKQTNLNAQEIGEDRERAEQWKRWDRNPVFSEAEVAKMAKQGLKDLTAMQLSDGGWGWFSGFGERSYPHTTAVVVHGMQVAVENDLAIADQVLARGVAWLKSYQERQVALLDEAIRREDMTPEQRNKSRAPYKSAVDNTDALVFMTLVDADVVNDKMLDYLFRDRLRLSLYSQALAGLAYDKLEQVDKRDRIIRNLDQFLKVDEENQSAYLDVPTGNYWWYGSQVEANAFYLKLLSRVEPQGPKASGLVKFLLNNRKHGTYWNSTRDTAYCIEALAEFWAASGETQPNTLVEIWIDGKLLKSVEITAENLFSYDNSVVLEGEQLTSGPHRVEVRKKPLNAARPAGPIYFNAYLTNFTTEDFITKAGLEIKVERKYYRMNQVEDAEAQVQGNRGQVIDQQVLKYEREELVNLSEVRSGDLIEIELEIESKNDYEYVLFEDFKVAGCEPVDLRSGYTRDGLGAYVEFRDEKVAFFMRRIARGTHSMSYRVRAEVPGKFSALPTNGYAMYAPELRANSDEMKLTIEDRKEE